MRVTCKGGGLIDCELSYLLPRAGGLAYRWVDVTAGDPCGDPYAERDAETPSDAACEPVLSAVVSCERVHATIGATYTFGGSSIGEKGSLAVGGGTEEDEYESAKELSEGSAKAAPEATT